ncbi:hypothetical protein OX284_005345 [Flavobacterium sp. SUN046]|uniref:hypothetical protein n=1 Tax=Flavobacterium sp. SUN046 TaxID=3002440 RepID=UPI002DB92E0C|nr:hypothetical protein [Flavobacterium sp. SUN046]MEC4048843.1 hypothetical protein [Flavobacterium sp. SUN046]
MKDNLFSLYDFLGYFVPGIFTIYTFKIVILIKENSNYTFEKILSELPSYRNESISLIILMSYLIGHILSFSSSITIEKYSIWKYGYPSRYLLRMPFPNFFDHYKSLHGCIWGTVMLIIIFPLAIIDYFLSNLLGFKFLFVKSLDINLIKVIIFKINKLLDNLGINKSNGFNNGEGNFSDFNRIIHHYVFENSKNHQKKLTNYVALYGFLRTFTLIFVLLFWYILYHFFLYGEFTNEIIILLSCVLLLSFIFFMSFMKFFRKYTLEGLMIIAIDKI